MSETGTFGSGGIRESSICRGIVPHETGRLPLDLVAYVIPQLCRGVIIIIPHETGRLHPDLVAYVILQLYRGVVMIIPHETGRLPLDLVAYVIPQLYRGVIIIPHETGRLPPDLVVYVIPQYGVVSHHMRESKEVWLNFNLRYTSHQHALVYPLYTIYNNSVSALHNLQQ